MVLAFAVTGLSFIYHATRRGGSVAEARCAAKPKNAGSIPAPAVSVNSRPPPGCYIRLTTEFVVSLANHNMVGII